MNTYFIKRFIARTAVVLSAAALFCGCSDDDETSTLHFDKPEVVIGPESSTASFILRSDTSWKLHSDADWFTLNLTKGAKSASVIITYSENTSMTEKRTAVITATTLSGDASDSFILSQMPVESYIRLETEALPISATAAHHEIAVETSIDSGIDLSVSYGDEEGGAWIENLTLADGKLAFDAGENGSSERRIAVISLLYQDEFGRTTEAAVRITQSFSMNPSAATEKDFAFAAALGAGDVEENVYVTGQIVLDGRNANFPNRRYSIQDAEGRALLFESTIDLGVARNDRVRLWLLGSTVKEVAEGTFTYKVFTGIAAEHIMQKEAGSPVQPREVYIRDLTDEMLFSLVRLRDVEIAMPYGGLVNYDEYYVSGGGVNVYGKNLTKYYGTCLRDINGDHLYMLTNFGVDYRRHSLPMGSGTVTGILTREYNSNFGEMGAFQIRHLTQAEIALDPSAREQLQQGARRVDLCQTRRIQGGRDPRRPDDRPGVRLALQEQCRRFLQRLPRRQRPHLFRQQAARRRRLERSGYGQYGQGRRYVFGAVGYGHLLAYQQRLDLGNPFAAVVADRDQFAAGYRTARFRSRIFDRRYVVDGRSGRQLYRHRPVRLEKCAASLHARFQGLRLRPARSFAGQGVGQHSSALRQPDRNRRQVVGRAQRHEPAGPRIYQV